MSASAEIFYNNQNVSDDYYEHEGEYFDIVRRVLWRTKKKELCVLSEKFGEGIIFDRRFRIIITQEHGNWDNITDFRNPIDRTVRFEFMINDEKFENGKLTFSIIPDRVEIESEGDDDKKATIALICKKKEFVISLIPDEKE